MKRRGRRWAGTAITQSLGLDHKTNSKKIVIGHLRIHHSHQRKTISALIRKVQDHVGILDQIVTTDPGHIPLRIGTIPPLHSSRINSPMMRTTGDMISHLPIRTILTLPIRAGQSMSTPPAGNLSGQEQDHLSRRVRRLGRVRRVYWTVRVNWRLRFVQSCEAMYPLPSGEHFDVSCPL